MQSKKSKSKHNPKLLNHQLHFEAIGTRWQIDLYNLDDSLIPNIKHLILNRIELFDQTYSRFRDDSLVKKISKHPGEYILDDDGKKMVELYKKLYLTTNGVFTILIGNVLVDAGYDDKYSLTSKQLQKPSEWEDALEVRYGNLNT